MALSTGDKLGPYEISGPLGAGGMGEVYKARDTALNRDVAIKVLPDTFASDPDRLARFQREAQALAALNHPNIAQVYGLEGQALVMELVEGEDLSVRIARGPIALDDALAIARQIADALEAAHEAGIVHRDLKPANVKVTDDGTVKVLDFGLAKALGPEQTSASPDALANSPTLTARATQMGMILGTAAYMAPEQARGKRVDKRADIWAFGVVLYEMVTGRRLFDGEDLTETLASVVKEQPDLSSSPREVRRLIDKCLQKNPKQRLRDIGDAWNLLDTWPASGGDAPSRAASSRLPWTLTGVAALALAVLSVLHFGEAPEPIETSRFHVRFPGGSDRLRYFVEVSPDGRHLVLVADEQLWVRSFDSLEVAPLDRTQGASYPFWSPDSTSIGFFADGQLKTISRTGESVQTLAEAADGRGGAWSPNGTILFSAGAGRQGLSAVSEQGGGAAVATTIAAAGSDAHRYPQFLPGGDRFLYLHLTSDPETQGIYVGSLDGTSPIRVLDGGDQARFAPSVDQDAAGHLLFRRRNTLMAQPFDAGSAAIVGAAFQVADGVGQAQNTGSGAFSASTTGVLIYAQHTIPTRELVWLDRAGSQVDSLGQVVGTESFAISPDQQLVAMSVLDDDGGADLWLKRAEAESPLRFTFGPTPGWFLPVWSPDSSEIVYSTLDLAGLAQYELRRKPSDMAGTEEMVLRSDGLLYTWDWAPDGSFLVIGNFDDVFFLPLEGDSIPVPVLETSATENYAQISPDGRWLAYASDEQGEFQVYVQPVPATGSLWQISPDGGTMPRWRRDGRELFYRAPDGTLTAIDVGENVASGPASFQYSPTPRPLFSGVPSLGNVDRFTYQPAADGQRFLLALPVQGAEPPIAVVLNWQAASKR